MTYRTGVAYDLLRSERKKANETRQTGHALGARHDRHVARSLESHKNTQCEEPTYHVPRGPMTALTHNCENDTTKHTR